jgi:hypothetical protein
LIGARWALGAFAVLGGPPVPEPPASPIVEALWFDGNTRLFAAGPSTVHVTERGGASRTYPIELASIEDADGQRGEIRGVAVLAARDGWIARFAGVGWELEAIPLLPGDALAAVTVDGNGRIWAVGERRALYLRDAEGVRVHEYPHELSVHALAAACTPGGQVFIVGRDGMVLRYDGRTLARMVVVGTSAAGGGAPWKAAWYSPDSDDLWVRAGTDRLLAIDVGSGTATEFNIPLVDLDQDASGDGPAALDGVPTGTGDRLALSMGRAVYLFEDGRFRWLGTEAAEVRDLAIVHDEDAVWVATRAGLSRRSLVIPTEHRPMRPLTGAEARRLEELERRERRAASRRPTGRFWAPSLRASVGPAFHPGDRAAAFVEARVGVMTTPLQVPTVDGPALWIWPEIGWGFSAHPDRGGHFGSAGLGLGLGTHVVAGYWTPGATIGPWRKSVGFGLRHQLSLQVLWGVLGVELGHAIELRDAAPVHELRLGGSINLAPLLWLAIVSGQLDDGPRVRGRRARGRTAD